MKKVPVPNVYDLTASCACLLERLLISDPLPKGTLSRMHPRSQANRAGGEVRVSVLTNQDQNTAAAD